MQKVEREGRDSKRQRGRGFLFVFSPLSIMLGSKRHVVKPDMFSCSWCLHEPNIFFNIVLIFVFGRWVCRMSSEIWLLWLFFFFKVVYLFFAAKSCVKNCWCNSRICLLLSCTFFDTETGIDPLHSSLYRYLILVVFTLLLYGTHAFCLIWSTLSLFG